MLKGQKFPGFLQETLLNFSGDERCPAVYYPLRKSALRKYVTLLHTLNTSFVTPLRSLSGYSHSQRLSMALTAGDLLSFIPAMTLFVLGFGSFFFISKN